METYLAVKNADKEQTDIANFWDCNPYKLNVTGHVMHATKKITPGGHWINIIGVAGKKSNAGFLQAVHSYAMVSIGLFDAFISCWDEKYRSVLVRPETVINENIDAEWAPMLQTPPFPEYTSGHSVASSAASVILTSIFGDDFAFDDDTEVEFGLPVRSFKSFYQAADEASISRLYGGIHYRPAIENGVKQGKAIGELVVNQIKCKKE
jgi:PAP2 superfamily